MKEIKIYSFGTHERENRKSGVDFVRVYQPMKYLNGFEYQGYKFHVDSFDIKKKDQDDWNTIADKYDLVFLNYIVWDWAYAHMGVAVHGKGKKIVLDLDDDLWHVQSDNFAYEGLQKIDAPHITSCIVDDVDGVIVTNRYLRNVVADKSYKRHDQISVIPNYIDLSLYNRTFPAQDRQQITLLHYGSTSHFEDLLNPAFVGGIDRIFSEYPNVKIKMVGAFIPQLKAKWGLRYDHAFGHEDIYQWIDEKFPPFMEEADIMVVPLRDTVYNRCKSHIKALETASAKKPGVFSDVRPYADYIEHGKTGFLAKTSDDWYTHLKKLIDSVELRREIGENAYQRVLSEQAKDHVEEYAEYFLRVLEKS